MVRKVKSVEGRGGYPAGDKLVSELGRPPSGPGAGAKPRPKPTSTSNGDRVPADPDSEDGSSSADS
jgi:hypothetical protein